jgi:hypothetical protein
MSDNSNSEEGGGIGFKPAAPLKVEVRYTKPQPAVGRSLRVSEAPAAAPRLSIATAVKKPAAPAAAAPVVAAAAPVVAAAAPEEKPAEPAPVLVVEEKPVAVARDVPERKSADEEDEESESKSERDDEEEEARKLAAAAAAKLEALHKEARKRVKMDALPPAESTIPTTGPPPAYIAGAGKEITKLIRSTEPAEILPPPVEAMPEDHVYRPISAGTFRDFIMQTFLDYAPSLVEFEENKKLIAAGAAPKVKEINKEACKTFDPSKVETFYYQKFVRDYLTRMGPYRGLLVYHGLGTGKTCTSIAAAEALYWGGLKKIFILTPATLSNNYRRELGKCGFFPLKERNYWEFLPLRDKTNQKSLEFYWITETFGLPADAVLLQGGAWIPNPKKPTNWDTLSADAKASIRAQQKAHLAHRFKFIHYNGASPKVLADIAREAARTGKGAFDNHVVIIDEVHNLVRTINSAKVGRNELGKTMKTIEPREPTWSMPIDKERPGYRYPRTYILYRLLQNAVGAKVIALSATPMINYSQELAILLNMIGGEQRVVELSLKGMDRSPATARRLLEWAAREPTIDYFKIGESPIDRSTVLNITPVPFMYAKVVGDNAALRGFVRITPGEKPSLFLKETGHERPAVYDERMGVENSRERRPDLWAVHLMKELEKAGILAAGKAVEAETEIAAGKTPAAFRVLTMPLLPEDQDEFVGSFVDRATLKIKNGNALRSRAMGLVSFYRGGSEEFMPRTGRNEIVEIPMTDYMFQEYTRVRGAELDAEGPSDKPVEEEAAGGAAARRGGVSRAEQDLYALATKTIQTGFLAGSRAACNWVFPEEVPRPRVGVDDEARLRGVDPAKLAPVAGADEEAVIEPDMEVAPPAALVGAGGEEAEAAGQAVVEDEPAAVAAVAAAATDTPIDARLTAIIGTLMSGLEAKKEIYLRDQLENFSPKYKAILENIRVSPGPVLVYSQFKTLEGIGIFAAALRAAPEAYLPLDVQLNATGEWEIPEVLMEKGRSRYILYTGDQPLEKRRLLLQLYNADVAGLPPRLSAQCAELLKDQPDGKKDNRTGVIAKVFMITQSGAEGISLFNTRQVHIMEPYWNNVRLHQVIGRAIRTCSHMNLPWDDRVVDVFTYVMKFSDKQKTELPRPIATADKGMTTDQIILNIAEKKQALADGLEEILQSASVDCELHFHEHGAVTACHRFPRGSEPMFMYQPDWKKTVAGEAP